MMSIRSLADFNGSSLGGDSDWLTPPPSPPRPQTPGRHGERGIGTSNWPPAETFTWPHTGTFSWPRTPDGPIAQLEDLLQIPPDPGRHLDGLAVRCHDDAIAATKRDDDGHACRLATKPAVHGHVRIHGVDLS